MANRMTTVPLPLSLHLAGFAVIGLFCAFAGGLNLLDPTKYLHALAFLGVTGASWGYVFGIYMGRKEVVTFGLVQCAAYLAFGVWKLSVYAPLGLLLLAIGAYGLGALLYYRKVILEI